MDSPLEETVVAQLDRNYVRIARSRTAVRLLSYSLFEGRPPTTRGQWFNPVVAAHLRLAARSAPISPPVRPIFILGVGRSGTTLLGRLLGVHPHVGFLNEPKAMWHQIDPLEDVTGLYNRSPIAMMRRSASDVTPEMRAAAHRLYGHYQRVTRSRRVVDKYCELSYRRDYLRALFPDCVLIAIVRRPEAVIRSIEQWQLTNGSQTQDWWGVGNRKWQVLRDSLLPDQPDAGVITALADAARTDADRALIEWIVGMRDLTKSQAGGALNLLMRYEDLVADPVGQMARALDSAALPTSVEVEKMAS